MPISAVIGKADVMDKAGPSTIGGTYIGNPVSCAAAAATLQYMEEIDICAKGRHVGALIRARFEELQRKYSVIGDVRGLGAMIAIELVQNGDHRQPNAKLCAELLRACAARNLILISAGTEKNVLRVLCPLVISDELLSQGLQIIEEELDKLCG